MTLRTALLVPLVVLAVGGLSGCAEKLQSKEEAIQPLPAKDSIRMARATMSGGDARSAIAFYEQALKANPNDYDASLGIADAQYRTGEIVAAQRSYARASELDPKAIDPLLAQARIAIQQRDLFQAWALYERADALAGSRDPRPLSGMGVVDDLKGKPAEAQAFYRKALAIRPDDLATRNNLGLSLALAGDPRGAIDILMGIVQNPASPPQARHNLALAYGLLGNTEAAENVLATDLDAGSVQGNLRYYAMLRSRLTGPRLLVEEETGTP